MKVLDKLEKYKLDVLGINLKGTYKYDSKIYYKGYILPPGKKYMNIELDTSSYKFISKTKIVLNKKYHNEAIKIKFHTYWYHMNSSQVLALNYFYNILDDNERLTEVVRTFGINENAVCATLEYSEKDKTEVDVVIDLESGLKVYIEVKYTEKEFGKASSKTTDYRERKSKWYNDLNISFNDYIQHYQLVRNISFSRKGNYTVFLVPQFNTSIINKYYDGISKIDNIDKFNSRLFFWEDLLKTLDMNNVNEKYFKNVTSM